jgi:formyltetrahydrofolate deformylase
VTITQEAAPRARPAGLARDHASLIVQGKDRTGIVAAVGSVLSSHGANIVSLDSTPTIRRAARSSSGPCSASTA